MAAYQECGPGRLRGHHAGGVMCPSSSEAPASTCGRRSTGSRSRRPTLRSARPRGRGGRRRRGVHVSRGSPRRPGRGSTDPTRQRSGASSGRSRSSRSPDDPSAPRCRPASSLTYGRDRVVGGPVDPRTSASMPGSSRCEGAGLGTESRMERPCFLMVRLEGRGDRQASHRLRPGDQWSSTVQLTEPPRPSPRRRGRRGPSSRGGRQGSLVPSGDPRIRWVEATRSGDRHR